MNLSVVAALFLGFPIYFLPAYIAARRNLKKRRAILFWNLFTGITGIGWVILFFLAVMPEENE